MKKYWWLHFIKFLVKYTLKLSAKSFMTIELYFFYAQDTTVKNVFHFNTCLDYITSLTYTATGSLNFPHCCIWNIKSPPFTYSMTKYKRSCNKGKESLLKPIISKKKIAQLQEFKCKKRRQNVRIFKLDKVFIRKLK